MLFFTAGINYHTYENEFENYNNDDDGSIITENSEIEDQLDHRNDKNSYFKM